MSKIRSWLILQEGEFDHKTLRPKAGEGTLLDNLIVRVAATEFKDNGIAIVLDFYQQQGKDQQTKVDSLVVLETVDFEETLANIAIPVGYRDQEKILELIGKYLTAFSSVEMVYMGEGIYCFSVFSQGGFAANTEYFRPEQKKALFKEQTK